MTNAVNSTGLILAQPNLLINGQFRVSQRGALNGSVFTSATSPANNDDTYLLDKWVLLSDGNDIVDVSQEATIVPTGAPYSLKLDIETANKKAGHLNILEANDSKRIIGGYASLSFDAEKVVGNATVDKLRAAILSWDGIADSVTSDVVSAWNAEGVDPTLVANWTYENTPVDLVLTDSFQKFKIENIAIDTASTKNVAVFIWIDNDDGTIGDLVYISNVKLELGPVATPYPVEIQQELLSKCQRYAYTLASQSGNVDFGAGFYQSATKLNVVFTHPVVMRVAPSVTHYGTTSNYHLEGAGIDIAATSVGGLGNKYTWQTDYDCAGGGTTGQAGNARIVASSDAIILLSADL